MIMTRHYALYCNAEILCNIQAYNEISKRRCKVISVFLISLFFNCEQLVAKTIPKSYYQAYLNIEVPNSE